ncbi:MAG: hypothetical protein V3V11_05940, partial [Vicinamibacteria bacterium]
KARGRKVMAVVKANGYGHGLVELGRLGVPYHEASTFIEKPSRSLCIPFPDRLEPPRSTRLPRRRMSHPGNDPCHSASGKRGLQ